MKSKVRRIPRPRGVTGIMYSIHEGKVDGKAGLNTIRKTIIKTYALNGNRIGKEVISITDLARYLGMKEKDVVRYTMEASADILGLIQKPEGLSEKLNEVVGTALLWCLGDREAILRQVNILQAAQGNTYKPFVTGELNTALNTLLKSQAGAFELSKVMATIANQLKPTKPAGPTQVVQGNVIYGAQSPESVEPQGPMLTIAMASQLINNAAPKALPNPDNFENYLVDTPDVLAKDEVRDIAAIELDEDAVPDYEQSRYRKHRDGIRPDSLIE